MKELMPVADFSSRYLNKGVHKGGKRYMALLDEVQKFHLYRVGQTPATFNTLEDCCRAIYDKAVELLTDAKQPKDPGRVAVLLELTAQAASEAKYYGRRMHMGLRVISPMRDARDAYDDVVGRGFKEAKPSKGKPGSGTQRLTRGDATLPGNYWLEAYDDKHRPGFLLQAAWETWQKDDKLSYRMSFWDYLDDLAKSGRGVSGTTTHPVDGTALVQEVRYLQTEAERAPYLISVAGGLLKDHNGDLYDSGREMTHASGAGWAIFVMDERGRLFAGSHIVGVFHHSSFLAGAPTSSAGELVVNDGKVVVLTGKSGHYRPTSVEVFKALDVLIAHGVVSADAVVKPGFDGKAWYNALSWHAQQGAVSARDELSRDDVLKAIPFGAMGGKVMKLLPDPPRPGGYAPATFGVPFFERRRRRRLRHKPGPASWLKRGLGGRAHPVRLGALRRAHGRGPAGGTGVARRRT